MDHFNLELCRDKTYHVFKEEPTKLIAVQEKGNINLLFTVTMKQTAVMCSKCTRRNCKHHEKYKADSVEDSESSDSDSQNNGRESDSESTANESDSEWEEINESSGNDRNCYVPSHYNVSHKLDQLN